MSTRFVWRNRWLLLRWSAFALALAGLGWALYAWLPPAPRWLARGSISPIGFAPDGKTMRTQSGQRDSRTMSIWLDAHPKVIRLVLDWDTPTKGPIQAWDVDSGREVLRVLDDMDNLSGMTFSHDGRRLAAVGQRSAVAIDLLHLLDLDKSGERRALVETSSRGWDLHFSAGDKLLLLTSTTRHPWGFFALDAAELTPEPTCLLLYDAESLRLLTKEIGKNWRWQWAPDADALLLYAADDNGNATLRRIKAQRETTTAFTGAGDWVGITPDGRTLLTAWPRDAHADAPVPYVLLWDMASGQRRGEIPRCLLADSVDLANAFLTAGRDLVIAQQTPAGQPMAVVWDIETLAPLGKVPLQDRRILVSSERNVFALFKAGAPNQLALYSPRPLDKLWSRDMLGGELRHVEFLKGTRCLLAETGDDGARHLELIDMETGQTRLGLRVQDQHRILARGQYLVVEETTSFRAESRGTIREMLDKWCALVFRAPPSAADFETTTRVFDTDTGEERCRLDLRGADLVDLAPDGRALFMYEEGRNDSGATLTCYDVPLRRYWAWIVGVPLTLGVLLLALRAGWRRLRRSPAVGLPVKP